MACGEISHYINKCKNRKNDKLIEAFCILEYFELSEEEALDLNPKNNKGIVEIILEYEYKESDYEETSHMMESSFISHNNL